MNRKLTLTIGLNTRHGSQLSAASVVETSIVGHLADYGVDGFTVTEGRGYWRGNPEPCVVVTIYCEGTDDIVDEVATLAAAIATDCDQECVLWACETVNAGLADGER